ncbi:hypothetical protein [Winslowiella iniecta]|uniref:Uncharacterized protein n=1 Tax=Winslowiella iniecta TaxID=1560201 RepID=A0A0L7T430_9GAMM|nr:hypothetical protein [Winslowiella iniecta]KOC90152.1 hypothetical protein NG42_10265 [Winslowiella iniecta]KOC94148.1 hypothetical protein NG43_06810 [Winslowiella iniecta]
MNKRNALIKFILPVIILAAIMGYMSLSRVESQEQAYYVAVYCQVVKTPDTPSYRDAMRAMIDAGNSDYALDRKKFNLRAADNVLNTVSKLTDAQRSMLKDNATACRQLISAKMAG